MGGSAISRWLPVSDENVFSTAPCLYPTHLYTVSLKGTCWGSSYEAFSSKFAAAGLCYFNGGEETKKVSGNDDVSNSNPKPSGIHPAVRYQLTSGLIAANVLAYIADRRTYLTLTLLGSKDNYWIRKGQLWRLVTCSFLHTSPTHLLVNCWSLFFIGSFIESVSGPKRYLAVYFASAIAGSGFSYWLNKSRYCVNNPSSVGASVAIFGLLGSFAVFVMRHWEYMDEREKKLYKQIATTGAMNAASAEMVKQIDNMLSVKQFDNRRLVKQFGNRSHLGGFVGGAAASWLLGPVYKCESLTTADGKRIYVDSR